MTLGDEGVDLEREVEVVDVMKRRTSREWDREVKRIYAERWDGKLRDEEEARVAERMKKLEMGEQRPRDALEHHHGSGMVAVGGNPYAQMNGFLRRLHFDRMDRLKQVRDGVVGSA